MRPWQTEQSRAAELDAFERGVDLGAAGRARAPGSSTSAGLSEALTAVEELFANGSVVGRGHVVHATPSGGRSTCRRRHVQTGAARRAPLLRALQLGQSLFDGFDGPLRARPAWARASARAFSRNLRPAALSPLSTRISARLAGGTRDAPRPRRPARARDGGRQRLRRSASLLERQARRAAGCSRREVALRGLEHRDGALRLGQGF